MRKWIDRPSYKIGFFILKQFQGLGLMISFDNPNAGREYWMIEFKFLWLSIWFIQLR